MERKQTVCPKVDSPHPLNSQEARALTCRERGLHAETAQSALTVILKLGIGGLTSVMLVVSGVVPGSVCSSFFEASSQNCGSLRHGYSVVIMQLTSSMWRGFPFLRDSSQDMAQSVIYCSWEGTKGPWLCLMAKLLLLGLLWLFSFVSAFSHFSG